MTDGVTNCNQIEIADDRMSKYTIVLAVPKNSRKNRNSGCSNNSSFQINMLNIFVVLSIALFLSVSMVQAAPTGSSNSTDLSTSSSPEITTPSYKICHSSTPCGWAVYVPFTRRVDYFMKNTCSCPPEKACLKSDDDLSVSAYVYRCGNKPSTEPDSSTSAYYE